MNLDAKQNPGVASDTFRVDLIDSWHKQWPIVLGAIDRAGTREKLMIDSDGWLSARQSLFVAFAGDEVAGHLVFRVEPAQVARLANRPRIDARLDGVEVSVGFDAPMVRKLLVEAASGHAARLRCRQLIGFEG